MQLLLDQGLPRSTVPHLQGMGIEAEHVRRLPLIAIGDQEAQDDSTNDSGM